MFDPKTKFMQRGYFPKIPLKSYLPRQSIPNLPQRGTAFNQLSYQFHHQVPWTLETQVSSLLILRPIAKFIITYVSKIEQDLLKQIKCTKAQLAQPKTSTPTQKGTKQAYKKLIGLQHNQGLNFPSANNVHLPT